MPCPLHETFQLDGSANLWSTCSWVKLKRIFSLPGIGVSCYRMSFSRSRIEEVQDFATQWMNSYNHDRQNTALGVLTPMHHLAMAA